MMAMVAGLLGMVALAMISQQWFWSGRNSETELSFETAQLVVFDHSRELETRYAALGFLGIRINKGIKVVAAKLSDPLLGSRARATLVGLQQMLDAPVELRSGEVSGDYAATLIGIERGEAKDFDQVLRQWGAAISVLVRAQRLHPRFDGLVKRRIALHQRRLAACLR